jgi:hypothetical protein
VFPVELVNNNLAWHVSVNAQKYGTPDKNKIKVTMEDLNSGKVCTFSNNTSVSTADGITYYNVSTRGYGISNSIIFRPARDTFKKFEAGDVFRITVSGLNKELSYTVKMFSLYPNGHSDAPLYVTEFTTSATTVSRGERFSVAIKFAVVAALSSGAQAGVALMNGSNIVAVLKTWDCPALIAGAAYQPSGDMLFPANVPCGNYRLTVVIRQTERDNWRATSGNNNIPTSIDFTVIK